MASFWTGRRVLITGHTGFKGAWLAYLLHGLGAKIWGISLPPSTKPNMHDIIGVGDCGEFVHEDINDRNILDELIQKARPEVVIHLAAQALVRDSYTDPVGTFLTNVIGTVNLLDSLRKSDAVKSIVIVTSDKAYENKEWAWGYRETDHLGGYDPYSASKGCAEIAAISMRRSFYQNRENSARIATVRAGNVIGGGDWSNNRLVPDIIRGCLGASGVVMLRNPESVRPWQHVLEPLKAYLLLAEGLYSKAEGFDDSWNIGPESSESRPVHEVAQHIITALGVGRVEVTKKQGEMHEAGLLTLDCSKIKSQLGWKPILNFEQTIKLTTDWYLAWSQGKDMSKITGEQIKLVMEGS